MRGNDGVVVSRDGTFKPEWAEAEAVDRVWELQQATMPDFADAVTRYSGPDHGSVITGLAEGTYYFRVREMGGGGGSGAWSMPLEVRVEFFSTPLVVTMLFVGFAVVAVTVGAILHGHFRREEA